MIIKSPVLRAAGRDMSAIKANTYAHHIVETPDVIFAANFVLKLLTF
jgi:hypothetical protein